jgi:uncharacterized protein
MTYPAILVYSSADEQLAVTGDCNCACAQPLVSGGALDLAEDTRVERHPALHSLPLTHEFDVAFVPSESRVAVVNQAAVDLLAALRTARALGSLREEERRAARQLFTLGLIQETGRQVSPPPNPDELIAWLHVTNQCNLRCTYCYLAKTNEAMTPRTARAAIDTVLEAARLHGYSNVMLKYAGGEATLNMPLVEDMQRYAETRAAVWDTNLRGVVLSNGVRLNPQMLERIQRAGLRLMISLDGPQAIHDAQRPTRGGQGSYSRVVAGIERARALGLDLTISITVTGASVTGLPELVEWLLARDLHFSLNFYRDNDCSASFSQLQLDEHRLIDGLRAVYRVIEQQLPSYSLLGCLLDRANLIAPHDRTCAVGENYLVIDQQGRVAKCQMEIERPITSIWEPDPLRTIRLDTTGVQNLSVDQKEGCRECAWRYWCAGGCPIATFRATGRYDVKSPNCGIYQALYPEVLRLEGLRILRQANPSALRGAASTSAA